MVVLRMYTQEPLILHIAVLQFLQSTVLQNLKLMSEPLQLLLTMKVAELHNLLLLHLEQVIILLVDLIQQQLRQVCLESLITLRLRSILVFLRESTSMQDVDLLRNPLTLYLIILFHILGLDLHMPLVLQELEVQPLLIL